MKSGAWMNAALQRMKRMPSFASFLNDGRRVPRRELERQLEEAKRREARIDAVFPKVIRG